MFVGGDEVGVDLFLGLADLYAEGWDLLEGARFYAHAVELAFLHRLLYIWFNTGWKSIGRGWLELDGIVLADAEEEVPFV